MVGSFVEELWRPKDPPANGHVHVDAIGLDTRGARRGHAGVLRRLGGGPHLQHAVVAHPTNRVVRFHRRVREVRHFVERIDNMGGRANRLVSVSLVAHDDGPLARFDERAMQGAELFGTAALGVGIIPGDDQSLESAMGVGERFADDGDAIVDRYHRDDTGLAQGGAVVDRGRLRAEPRRVEHDRREHPGRRDVDRELRLAEDLVGGIDAQTSLASDQLVRRLRLRFHAVGNGELLGALGQFGKRGFPARWMADHARLHLDLLRWYLPLLGGGRNESGARLRGDQAEGAPVALRRVGRAGDLELPAELGVAVHVPVAAAAVGRVHDPDGVEIGVELLGDDRRQAGVNPLAHLDLAREHDDGAVGPDADVRLNRIGGFFVGERHRLGRGWRRERRGPLAGCEHGRGVVDRFPYPRVRAAPTKVAVHPPSDRRVVRRSVRVEQRHRGERLAGLAIAALHDVVVGTTHGALRRRRARRHPRRW